ncbi:MAG: dihydropteroate synthase [Cyanobacteria bacterium]|nr:dihydropteroate synthase [Cyanobacteriota bacterium]MDA0865943.1 dihydropteroate synthase [Cyanobacteriota bacterium]
MPKPHPWILRDRSFNWGDRTYVMGVLNITPDSFSDGGRFNSLETGLAQAQELVKAGVDMLDIGGQSTRPGAQSVPVEAELRRVVPVIEAIRHSADAALQTAVISVDTTRAEVARAAVRAGADLVNDISGGTFDRGMLSTVADLGVPIVLMHIRGTPATMQNQTNYEDLLGEIISALKRQINTAIAAGVNANRIIVDPGIGFGKSYPQNLEILRRIPDLQALGCPILIGPSRKSFIGWLLAQPDPTQRVWGTAAACCAAIAGGADILRIHDGREMVEVSRVADAVWRPQRSPAAMES